MENNFSFVNQESLGTKYTGAILKPTVQKTTSEFTLYNELLSQVVAELDGRFVNNAAHKIALGLLHLFPMCGEVESEDENSTRT